MRAIQSALVMSALVGLTTPAFAKHHSGASHSESMAGKKKTEKHMEKKEEKSPESMTQKMEKTETKVEQESANRPSTGSASAEQESQHHAE